MAFSIWCSRGPAHSQISWQQLYQLCRMILSQLLRISANRLTNDPLISSYIFSSSYLIHIFNVAVFCWFHKGSVRSGTIAFRGLQNIQFYMLEKLCHYRLGRLGNAGKHDWNRRCKWKKIEGNHNHCQVKIRHSFKYISSECLVRHCA